MKIDWKRKLTSRKFWAAIVGFVTPLIIAFGGTEETAVQISGIIMAGAAVIAYIIGEGLADINGYMYNVTDYVNPQTDIDDEIEDAQDLDESEAEEDDTEAEG